MRAIMIHGTHLVRHSFVLCMAACTCGCFGLVEEAPFVDLDSRNPVVGPAAGGVTSVEPDDAPEIGGGFASDSRTSGGRMGSGGVGVGGATSAGGTGGLATGGAFSSGGNLSTGGTGGVAATGGTTGTGGSVGSCKTGQWILASKSYTGGAVDAVVGTSILSRDAKWVLYTTGATNVVPGDTNGFPDSFLYSIENDTTARVTLGHVDQQANNTTVGVDISGTGRYVLIQSNASNLHPADTDEDMDSYVRDLQTGTLELVSQSSTGEKANASAYPRAISADGRFVTLISEASNLVPGDTSDWDVFVYDRQNKTMELVSEGLKSVNKTYTSSAAAISADGRYVAFHTGDAMTADDKNGVFDIYVRDRALGVTKRVTKGIQGTLLNDHAFVSTISSDGRFLSGYAIASNLIANDTNAARDAFFYDTLNDTVERMSVDFSGQQIATQTFQATHSRDGTIGAYRSTGGTVLLYNVASGKVSYAAQDKQGNLPQNIYSIPSFSGDSSCMALSIHPGPNWEAQFSDVGQAFIYGLK